MDNLNYTPKRLNSKIYSNTLSSDKHQSYTKSTNTQIVNESIDINNQNIFPSLTPSIINNDKPIINWNAISKNISDEPIKELDKKKNNINNEKETQQNNIILEPINDNKIITQKIKPSYVDESGWTHVVKSNKPTYKEKKKKNKNTEDIDKLIEDVIKK